MERGLDLDYSYAPSPYIIIDDIIIDHIDNRKRSNNYKIIKCLH